MMKNIFVMVFLVSFCSQSFGSITFDANGKWETTFDCVETVQPSVPDCNDVEWGVIQYLGEKSLIGSNVWSASSVENEWYYTGSRPNVWTIYYGTLVADGVIFPTNKAPGSLTSGYACIGDNDSLGHSTWYMYSDADPDSAFSEIYTHYTHSTLESGDYKSSIISAANNSGGSGNGYRIFVGDGVNPNTTPMSVVLPSVQTELWLRYYIKYETGFVWAENYLGNLPQQHKHAYLFTGQKSTAAIPGFLYDVYKIGAQNTPVAHPVQTVAGDGWAGIMGGDQSDGLYHCYEVYVKMDTDSTDGIGRIWLDGVLKAEDTSVDWSGGSATARLGWIRFTMGENQASPLNGSIMAVDYDDIVLYNTTPPNLDADNNPYIGPIATSADPIVEILTASGQTTTASVLEITGTATADTGLTIAGVTCPGQTVTAKDGAFDGNYEEWECQAVLLPGVNNLIFTGTDSVALTGTDSIDVTRSPIKAAIRGTATIKNATMH